MKKLILPLLFIAFLFLIYWQSRPIKDVAPPDYVKVQLLDNQLRSRTGKKLEKVRDIVVHYVGNPNTTAQGNWSYFAEPDTPVSSHFIIGLEGEIIQAIPLDEASSATNWRNKDTISIEVCHPDASGKFSEPTTESLVKLCAWLLDTYDLSTEHLIRHYDVTGKECPRYFVRHPDAWETFKAEVQKKEKSPTQGFLSFALLNREHQFC